MSLFDDDDDEAYGLFDDKAKGEVDAATEDAINSILESHDPDGSIASQVCEGLEKDSITLALLAEFDDMSLKEIIDSWNINTFSQKSFLIRGLLINGIKKLRKPTDKASHSQSTIADNKQKTKAAIKPKTAMKSTSPAVATVKAEAKAKVVDKQDIIFEELSQYEQLVIDKIGALEKDMKNSDKLKTTLLKEYKNEIESFFKELNNQFNERRNNLVTQLTNIFDNNSETQCKNILELKSIETEISNAKTKDNRNIINSKTIISNILKNKDKSIKFKTSKVNDKVSRLETRVVSYECDISFEDEIISQIEDKIDKLGKISNKGGIIDVTESKTDVKSEPKPTHTPKIKIAAKSEPKTQTKVKTVEAEIQNSRTKRTDSVGSSGSGGSAGAATPIWKQHLSTKKTKTGGKGKNKYQASWMKKSQLAVSRALGNDDSSNDDDSDNNNGNQDNTDDWLHSHSNISKNASGKGGTTTVTHVKKSSGDSSPSWSKKESSKEENDKSKNSKPDSSRVSDKKKHPPMLKNLW